MTKPLLTLGIVFLVGCSAPVFGQATHGFQFTWTDPTERTDGTSLIPDEEIFGYRLQCAGQEQVETMIPRNNSSSVEGDERTYLWEGAVQRGGWYECKMTAIDVNELESDWSNVASVRKLAIPTPPRNVRGR